MNQTWLDCNGTVLQPGDICKFPTSTIAQLIHLTDTEMFPETVRDDLVRQLTEERQTIEHLLTTGDVHVVRTDNTPALFGPISPAQLEFVSRPEKETYE